MKKIRTRFAPSPTGYLHIGGARTALFSYLYARRHGGDFILRIEDTDLERSTPESVNAILEGMAWLNLEYDEGPFYQTHRFDRYKEVIQQLLEAGHAYRCYMPREELDQLREAQMAAGEKPRYDGRWRPEAGKTLPAPPEGVQPVIRFSNPKDGEVVIEDLVRGRVVIRNEELDDLIIARSDGTPTYNLTVVVDDFDMGITHVIRGDDHLNNTPRQINIFRAMGAEPPVYGHLPMILGPDGAKLSKRHGAVSVMQYHEEGYLPEALLNYLVRLGWSNGDQEVFSREEMMRLFDVKDVNQSASAINPDKLLWLNQHYIKTSDPAHVARYLGWQLGHLGVDPSEGPALEDVIVALRERSRTLVEMAQQAACYFRDELSYDEDAAAKHLTAEAEPVLRAAVEALEAVSDWRAAELEPVIKDVVKAVGVKFPMLAQPMRVALVGSTASPSIDVTLALVGRERSLARLQKAITFIVASKSA
ncbi:MAG: glutamate--tRNA ligase [Halothiobacillaceae bacterium]|nr:MAG: glutamate--tRNA ligase [Halothiobacillaceae bacterium]